MMTNVTGIDRFLRLVAGGLAAEAGYFWLAAPWSLVAYGVAAILAITAIVGFCPIYRLFGRSANAPSTGSSGVFRIGLSVLVLVGVLGGGAYGSMFFTRKIFLEDFNAMNHFYKQTLFLTGQGKRDEANANYDAWKPAFEAFRAKYTAWRPSALKGDAALEGDFQSVAAIMAATEPMVKTGDLHEAHLALEKIRPIFQEVFKRNGFSLLAVALVDFHDVMETILEPATAKDAAKVIAIHPAVSEKLKAVETVTNDAEIQAIRAALEALLQAANAGQADALPDLGAKLKSSFVKVYLVRG